MRFELREVENSPAGAALVRELVAHNDRAGPAEAWAGFVLTAYGDAEAGDKIVGGVKGYSQWGWLFISHLWVAEDRRGTGLGRELLTRAEDLGRQRGCRNAWLDTFDFQAPGFYRRNGYAEFATLADFPPGHSRFFFRKTL